MRRNAGMNLGELRVVALFLLVLAAVALSWFVQRQTRAATRGADVDAVRAILEGRPGEVRPPASLRNGVLTQELPPAPEGRDVPANGAWVRVERQGNVVRVLVWNDGWARWLWGPFLALLVFGMGGLFWERRVGPALVACVFYALALGALIAVHWSTRYELEGARAIRRSYAFGIPCGSEVHEGTAGVAALQRGPNYLVLLFRRDGPPVPIASLPEASLGAVRRLQEAFEPR